MSPSANALYWTLVRACLTEFHGFSAHRAVLQVRALRRRLAAASVEYAVPGAADMVYHEEALTVADGIAQVDLAADAHIWDRYLALQESVYAQASHNILQLPSSRKRRKQAKSFQTLPVTQARAS